MTLTYAERARRLVERWLANAVGGSYVSDDARKDLERRIADALRRAEQG